MFSLPDAQQFARKTARTWRERARLRLQLLHAAAAVWVKPSFPDFMGIGAPRAATTWLHSRLRKHPDIYLPQMKELHFFDEPPTSDVEVLGMNLHRRYYFRMDKPSHLRWYALQVAKRPGRLSGDITPGYSALSEQRVRLISELKPDLKVIYVLRDPVDRAWSGLRRTLWWRKALRPEDVDDPSVLLELALHPELAKLGDYETAIRNWEKYFDPSQILYFFYEDVCERPKQQLHKVCEFLGVDVERLPFQERDSGRVNVAPKADMPEEVRQALSARYADQVPFLEAKFRCDLSHWLT